MLLASFSNKNNVSEMRENKRENEKMIMKERIFKRKLEEKNI